MTDHRTTPAGRRRTGFGCAAILLTFAAAAATGAEETPAFDFAAPENLRATLADPLDITLEWKDRATHERGYFVEYKLYRDEDFMVLGAVPAATPRFRHENLAPETRFFYRVRPFFGRVSPVVTMRTGRTPAAVAADDDWITPGQAHTASAAKSIRSPATATQAAPADFAAALVHGTGLKLTWRDRAGDEDGYIVEIKLPADPEFRVCALLEPDTASFGLAGLPEETDVAVRVRAFFYGPASNVVEKNTGAAGARPLAQIEVEPPLVNPGAETPGASALPP